MGSLVRMIYRRLHSPTERQIDRGSFGPLDAKCSYLIVGRACALSMCEDFHVAHVEKGPRMPRW
jgi:hypothetical protein